MGCEQAEIALLLEVIRDKIREECGQRLGDCTRVVDRVLNDLKELGKEAIRARYGL